MIAIIILMIAIFFSRSNTNIFSQCYFVEGDSSGHPGHTNSEHPLPFEVSYPRCKNTYEIKNIDIYINNQQNQQIRLVFTALNYNHSNSNLYSTYVLFNFLLNLQLRINKFIIQYLPTQYYNQNIYINIDIICILVWLTRAFASCS